jgi:hypothetical protein
VTCVAGIAENGAVHLCADSAGCSGWDLTVRADPKVFERGPYVLGFTDSFRMGQLLRYAFRPPEPPSEDLHGFMCTTFADAVRECLRAGGWSRKKDEREEGGSFLAGVGGRLFRVDADFQVGEPQDPYAAIGCGAQVAHGALFALAGSGMPPHLALPVALRAAERFSNGVRGPFIYACGGKEQRG